MDDMRNTSAPLYGKAEPATTKTTMSVREMRQLLGLGKTDSYWLLHKNLFEVILINDKRRIVISSFEKWYTNQVKYHKVNGSPPGEELCKRSYSVPDAAEILKVKPETIYTLIRQGKLKAETVDFWMRIPKEEFERWYRSQSRHRTTADRERDREIEAQTISIPEMAKLLGVPREKVYWIHLHKQRTSACGCCFTERLGKQKCHHSFSLTEFPLYHGSGSEKPQNRQQYPNHLSPQNSC